MYKIDYLQEQKRICENEQNDKKNEKQKRKNLATPRRQGGSSKNGSDTF